MDHVNEAFEAMLKEYDAAEQAIKNIIHIIDEIQETEKTLEAEEAEAARQKHTSD